MTHNSPFIAVLQQPSKVTQHENASEIKKLYSVTNTREAKGRWRRRGHVHEKTYMFGVKQQRLQQANFFMDEIYEMTNSFLFQLPTGGSYHPVWDGMSSIEFRFL